MPPTTSPQILKSVSSAKFTNTGTLAGAGSLHSNVENDGEIIAQNGTYEITGNVTTGTGDAGTLQVDTNAGLRLDQGVDSGQSVVFEGTGATLTIADPAAFKAAMSGFVSGDIIDLPGLTDVSGASVVNGNTLAVVYASGTLDLTLDPSQTNDKVSFLPSGDGGTGTALTAVLANADAPCFASGTRIRTPSGETPVQALRAGDQVLTQTGSSPPIRWIGHRRIDLDRHPNPENVRPIRIHAHAMGQDQPSRDLVLSPDHAVCLGDRLIPVRLLVNGASIRQDTTVRLVDYYHVELDRHDVLLAEGLPAESYLDTGNRTMFQNGGAAVRLHPDFDQGQASRLAQSCLPLTVDPASVETVWRDLARRAEQLGWTLPAATANTSDPLLRLATGARFLPPVRVTAASYTFVVPSGITAPRLLSRSVQPAKMRPWIEDRRTLGVRVRRLRWRDAQSVRDIALDDPDLRQGWWDIEDDGHGPMRWTNGDAALPDCPPGLLTVELAETMRYLASDEPHAISQKRFAAAG